MAKEKSKEPTGERIYTVPLRKEWLKAPRNKRGSRAVSTLKHFLFRHMKAADVKISQRLNEAIWTRGIQKPPAKIKTKTSIDAEGIVTVRLPEEMVIAKKEKTGGAIGGLKDRLMQARAGGFKAAAPGPEPGQQKQAVLAKEETTMEKEPGKKEIKKQEPEKGEPEPDVKTADEAETAMQKKGKETKEQKPKKEKPQF